ncbi:MAG: ABC transporter permease [Chelatococcus sp.]|jgi:peptide/nickel transport system permease protein|uniref:ABC transporter permease n=1 Tax=unclassified Chelatococcus TaxID=2638111 RepID=UPI001BD0EE67|nr:MULTISPECIES: ABC transporter permease [unclassified Chelatococcus]CAH1656400.1 Peptide/nickel transport system permease protein [Hyphomicrobiales bacterium]MBS7740528.1 ABC transporter permease [Chelatococcus sp. HY11]MBX3538055.1 ABC transporter permease [Chelatococcus sp.]MBX3544688.1 ABC transporter permease [Chelatococcus sp.]MCO5078229.1 ABC transporter permease [Chelatococcus sp.]
MSTRATFLARRVVQAAMVVVGVVFLSFFLVRLAPGDAAMAIAGETGYSDPQYVADLRKEFGLDKPVLTQFGIYLAKVGVGDLGFSYQKRQPVYDLIMERLPATLLLAGVVIVVSLAIGIFVGAVSAKYAGRLVDGVLRVFLMAFYAMPSYWLGLVLVLTFSVHLGWLPAFGIETMGGDPAPMARALDIGRHLVLPALTLGLFFAAIYARLTRAAMLEVVNLDFVRTARAKGISETRLFIRHVLRNALIPVVTYAGLQTSALVGGTVLVETVFSWPGIGRLAYDALIARDNNLLIGIFIFTSVLVVLFNLLTDLLYVVLDPRMELGK